MAKANPLSEALNADGEEPAESAPKFFTVTPRTIRVGYGSEVYQLNNITRIGKYRVVETRIPILFAILPAIAGIVALATISNEGLIIGVVFFAISAGIFWHRGRPSTYAFGFECNSGARRYFQTKDQKFIDYITEVITTYIEYRQNESVQINIEDRSVKFEGNMTGDIQTGGTRWHR